MYYFDQSLNRSDYVQHLEVNQNYTSSFVEILELIGRRQLKTFQLKVL